MLRKLFLQFSSSFGTYCFITLRISLGMVRSDQPILRLSTMPVNHGHHLLDICLSFVCFGYNELVARRLMKFLTCNHISGISPWQVILPKCSKIVVTFKTSPAITFPKLTSPFSNCYFSCDISSHALDFYVYVQQRSHLQNLTQHYLLSLEFFCNLLLSS